MSGESQNNEAVVAAPVEGNTAAPETVEQQVTQEEQETPKTFTQEELDAILAKRLAKEQRKWERQQQAAQQPQGQAPATEAPRPDQFKTPEEYVDALADFKADQKLAERENQKRVTEVHSTFAEREESARDKYSDYDAVVHTDDLRITPPMAEAIRESEMGPEVAYHLGKNPAEARRIAGLSPVAQVREIGKIEASLTQNPPVAKKASSAPEPIKPVGTRSNVTATDPTDPRSDKTMTDAEWIAARNKQLRDKR